PSKVACLFPRLRLRKQMIQFRALGSKPLFLCESTSLRASFFALSLLTSQSLGANDRACVQQSHDNLANLLLHWLVRQIPPLLANGLVKVHLNAQSQHSRRLILHPPFASGPMIRCW